MVSVSDVVGLYVRQRPFLEDALRRGFINCAALARSVKGLVELELGEKVELQAIVMALHRLSYKLKKVDSKKLGVKLKFDDVSIKSGLVELTVLKSDSAIAKLKRVYDVVDFSKGDFLIVSHGLYEITLIFNSSHLQKVEKIIYGEVVEKIIGNLAGLSLKVPIQAVETVGSFHSITRCFNWENISIIEMVSTLTELTLIVKESDVSRAFDAVKAL